jgi:hypothetical protein
MANAVTPSWRAAGHALRTDGVRRWRARLLRRWQTMWRPHVLFLHRPVGVSDDVKAALDDFARWCDRHEGGTCRLALSNRWMLSSAAIPAMNTHALREETVRHWGHYHDVDEASLAAEWVYRQASSKDIALACAAPRGLIEGLLDQADQHGVQLLSVQPWWAQAMQVWLLAKDGHPAGTDVFHLQLMEPGLVIHVEAQALDDGGKRVRSIWSEPISLGRRAETDGRRGPCLVLPMPTDRGEAECAGDGRLVWDHASLRPLLTGDGLDWGASV